MAVCTGRYLFRRELRKKKIRFQWARNGGVDTPKINIKILTAQPPLQSLNKQALGLLIREYVISPRDV
jgi:hypothetical protein